MTDEDFAAGVDAIISEHPPGHVSHRLLDELWTRYAIELGGSVAEATMRWMAAIEGHHDPRAPYPLGSGK